MIKSLPKNLWILAIIQPLAMSSAPMLILIGGLLGSKLAPSQGLITLPITLMVLGTALSAIPAAMIMKRYGRKLGILTGLVIALIGALINMGAAMTGQFTLLLLGSGLLGSANAFAQQIRFAAIDSVSKESQIGTSLSVIMLASLVAAFLGPEAAVFGKDLINSPHGFAGSFLLLAGLIIIAMMALYFYTDSAKKVQLHQGETRSLPVIMKQPIFIVAVLSATIGYGLMSFIMTATPISMHEMQQHSLNDTKWVIQSHIIAMFLPSLFSALLIRYFGIAKLIMAGVFAYALVVIIALQGHELLHYWFSLVLLGLGWNFLFLGGTTLLPRSYNTNEKFKVQAANDFIIFGIQAIASLSAGALLYLQGWTNLVWSATPFILIMFVVAIWLYRQPARV